MSNRDDFSKKVKDALAARAGWHCSMCNKHTVGPSEEGSQAITKIGKAAHIAAAAPGGRRYDAAMTPEQRAGIGNAIWLCADHAELIDRDAVTYPVQSLQTIKLEHEKTIARAVRTGAGVALATGLLGIGPEVICTGDLVDVTADSWTLCLAHFLTGDMHKLVSFVDTFAASAPESRYILCNELGDGRTLRSPPRLTKEPDGFYRLSCPVAPSFARTDVHRLGGDFAIHPETHDFFLDETGDIARVSGLDYLPQKLRTLFSLQKGESVFAPDYGVRFFEYYEMFKGSPWLDLLLKLDVVRQAAIPFPDSGGQTHTPLQCVDRVREVALLAEGPKDQRFPLRVALDVHGLGKWEGEVSIHMPTAEQMASRAELVAEMACVITGAVDCGHVELIPRPDIRGIKDLI